MKSVTTSIKIICIFSLITGILYPAGATMFGYVFFRDKAEGSLIRKEGRIRGSYLIGQKFLSPEYFRGRLSASGYDSRVSGGTNFGPTNPALAARIKGDADSLRTAFGLSNNESVPSDLVTASASGLDPHISVEAALQQCASVARARSIDVKTVESVVSSLAEKRYFDIAGERIVNVVRLNLTLDALNAFDGEMKRNAGNR